MARPTEHWAWFGPRILRNTVIVLLSLCLGLVYTASPHSSSFPQELLVNSNSVISFADQNSDFDVNVIDEREIRSRRDSSTGHSSNLTTRHFYLWTRTNAGNSSYYDLDPGIPNTITNSTFQPRTTYIIVHGFLGWGIESWILLMKDKLLNMSDCNVISVDWPAGTEWWLLSYYTAVSRVPFVGKDTAWLLRKLVKHKGLNLKSVHFIGHSLGAHVSGLASQNLKTRVGRISGLDPAGLKFHNVPKEQRLDKSDADYVDVIHTNGCYTFWRPWTDCYGINENLGHSDFWPNGGEHQPACQSEIGCDHELAYTYYLESISYGIDDTYFLARNCSAWNQYEEGECPCGDEAQYMGFFANTGVAGVFYLNTSVIPPYAVRDSVCSPGSKTDASSNIALIASCTSGSVVVVAIAGAIVFVVRRRKKQLADSGLLVESEGSDCDDALLDG
ncbi:pancreatic lipase-related protein 2-like isoform X2 [Penaeus japonicus]|uniref:pancreatic lipase-related protein 2-like isoform X2 n=1 Tax=Penaeus japonicus TaxID=27405 RepID=UPI001C712D84|nr:pancreatic lipase-related protein 2-like isoform X2 [Penaeus japonicus]